MGIIKKIIKKMKKEGINKVSYNQWDHGKEYKELSELKEREFKKEKFTIKLNFISGCNSGMCQEPNEIEVLALHNFNKA